MSDTTQTKILSLQFVGLDQQTKSIDTLQKQIKELNAEIKKAEPNSKAFDFLVTAQSQLKGELKEVEKGIKATNKAFEDSKHAVGSFRDLEAQLVKAKNALKGMKEGTPIFEKQATEVRALDKEVKRLAADMGEMQRNVGNYDAAVEAGLSKIHPHLVGMRGELASVTGEIGSIASGLGGIGGQFGQLLGGGSQLLSAGGGLAAGMVLAQGFGEAFKYAMETTKEVSKLRYEVQQLTGAGSADVAKFAAQIAAVGKAFEVDNKDIELAAQNLTTLTGDYQTSLDIIEKGFLSGANANGEMLDSMKEYSVQLESVGLSAEDLVNTLNLGNKTGVFSDKALDAVKEFGIRVGSMDANAKAGLESLGISSDAVVKGLENGTLKMGDVLKDVSNRIASLGKDSVVAKKAITGIFGSPGEDVGRDFINGLGTVIGQTEVYIDETSALTQKKEQELVATKDLATAQGELADKLGGIGANMEVFGTKAETFFTKYLTVLIDELSPITSILSDWWSTLNSIFGLFQTDGKDAIDFFDIIGAGARLASAPLRAVAWGMHQIAEGLQWVTDKISSVKMLGDAFAYVGSKAKSAMQFLGLADKSAPQANGGGGDSWGVPSGEKYAMPALATVKSPAQSTADKSAKDALDKRLAAEKKEIEDKYRAVNAELAKALKEMSDEITLKYLLQTEDIKGVQGRGVTITPKSVLNEKALQDQVTQTVKDALAAQEYLYQQQQEREKKRLSDRATVINTSLQEVGQGLDAIQTLESAARDRAISDQQTQAKKELQILEEKHNALLISDQDYKQQKLALEKKDDAEQQALKEKYGKRMKAVAISQILVNLALQESQIMLSATNPLNPANLATLGTAGVITGIAQMATLAIMAGVQIAAVSKQQYARGGDIKGPSHAGGGVDINAEGGEFVVNKRTMAIPGMAASIRAMNAMGNGALAPMPTYSPMQRMPSFSPPMHGVADVSGQIEALRQDIAGIKVFVTAGDITNALNRDRVRVRNSTR